MKKLTLKEAAQKAVKTHNVKMFAQIVDQLANLGFNYDDCAAFFARTTNIDKDQFENFSYEADSIAY